MPPPVSRLRVAAAPGATAASLLDATYKNIDSGHIRTWSYDDAKDFTHEVAQWKNEAWIRPVSWTGSVIELVLIPPKSGLKPDVRGVYLGRFSEMLIDHYEKYVDNVTIY